MSPHVMLLLVVFLVYMYILYSIFNFRFLNLLESEIYTPLSPIWRDDFSTAGMGGVNEMITAPSPAGSTAALSPLSGMGGPGSVGPLSVGPGSVGRGGKPYLQM